MSKQRIIVQLSLLLVFILSAKLAAADASSVNLVQELGQSVESLKVSIDRLETANSQWNQYNETLRVQVEQLNQRHQQFIKEEDVLKNKLFKWEQNAQEKQISIDKINESIGNFKKQISEINQSIEALKLQAALKAEEQKKVLEALAAAQVQAGRKRQFAGSVEQKNALSKQLEEVQQQVYLAQHRLDEKSAFVTDRQADIARLTARRDEYRVQLDQLKEQLKQKRPENLQSEDSAALERLKQLKAQVNVLTKQRLKELKLLQAIEDKYHSDPSKQNAHEEKKIEASIEKLKNENERIKAEVARLRVEMIRLDRQKFLLEKETAVFK